MDEDLLNETLPETHSEQVSLLLWKGYADRLFFIADQMGMTISMAVVKLIDNYLAHHPGYNEYMKEITTPSGRTFTVNTFFKEVTYPKRIAEQQKILADSSDVPKSAVPGP